MTSARECECSEEYGPCEDHSEVLAQREGASTRTADELLAVFIGDAEDIIGRPITEHDASAVAAEYWDATDNAGGWIDHDRFPEEGDPMTFADLPIGATFHFSLNPESGLLADVGREGRREYVKASARVWTSDGMRGRVGSIRARVWLVDR